MSASEPPSPGDIEQRFPMTPDEAQAFADAMSPVQDLAGAGAELGKVAEGIPGPGPKLAGVALQNASTHVDLAAVSVETLARAVEFYITAQTESVEMLFPPPHVAAERFGEDIGPILQAMDGPGGGPP